MTRGFVFWAVIAAAIALAWLCAPPPAPKPVSAQATAFSAQRAMADVRLIAREPHPIGSAANRAVRDRLLGRMTELGLQPTVQRGFSFGEMGGGVVGANVENLIGRLPGSDPSLPAVLLMAHYDSVPGSPGAADDAAGVAAILETVRALKAQGPAPRTVMVLLTDGEEVGLFGAEAFWKTAAAREVGVVVNLEARGSAGTAFMFETGPRNAGVTRLYGRHVERPSASSLSSWVYDRMPNGSDFTIAKRAGLPGVNIAMIGRPFDYHSATAVPENLSRRSLQHMGDQTLAMADALRREGPGARAEEPVYSDLFGRVHVSYPAWAGWLLLGLAAGLTAFAARRWSFSLRRLDIARGGGLFLLLLAWPALVAHAAFRTVPVGPDFYQSPAVAHWPLYFTGLCLLAGGAAIAILAGVAKGRGRWTAAGLALLLGGACSLPGGFDPVGAGLGVLAAVLSVLVLGQAADRRSAVLGLLSAGLLLTAILQALAPQTAFLIGWPTLAASVAAALLASPLRRPWRYGMTALVAALGLAWVFTLAAQLFDGLGLTNPELLGLFTALAGLLAAPFALRWLGRGGGVFSTSTLVMSGAAALAIVALRDLDTPRTPQPTHIQYVAEPASGRAWLVSGRRHIASWTREVLEASGPVRRGPLSAALLDKVWYAPAPPVPMQADISVALAAAQAPDVQVVDFGAEGPVRDLRARMTFSVPVTILGVNGEHRLNHSLAAGEAFRFRWYAPDGPVRLAFRPERRGTVEIRHTALAEDWPAGAPSLPPRPAGAMAWGASDAAITAGAATLAW